MQAMSLLPSLPCLEELYLGNNSIKGLDFDPADSPATARLEVHPLPNYIADLVLSLLTGLDSPDKIKLWRRSAKVPETNADLCAVVAT